MNYDSNGNITNIFGDMKNAKLMSQHTNEFAKSIALASEKSQLANLNIDGLARQIGNVDKGVVQAAKDMQSGTMNSKGFHDVVAQTTPKLAGLSSALKNVALNMGAMLAVMVAIKAIAYVVDELTVTFEEQKKIVDDLTSSVEDLQSEYNALKADPSASGEKLSYLKKQIQYQSELLEIEKERLALKDMQENMPDISSDTGTSGGHVNPTWTPDDVAESDIQEDLRQLEAIRGRIVDMHEKGTDNAKNYVYQNQIAEEKRYLQSLSDNVSYLKEDYLEIAEAKAKLEEYVYDGTLKGVNAELAREQIAEYQKEIDRLDPIIVTAEIALGTAHFTRGYDSLFDDIQNMPLIQYNSSIEKFTGEEMSSMINGVKDLNTALRDGEIASTEWFNSVDKLMTESKFDDAVKSVKDWSGKSTDELEALVSTMSSQLGNALTESTNKFLSGATSVSEYIDELQAGSEAQLTMYESLEDLKIVDGYAEATENASEATKDAVENYNNLKDSIDELEDVQGLADILSDDIDFFEDYKSWTDETLNSQDFQNHINELSTGIATFLQEQPEMVESFATMLEDTTGKSIDRATLLASNASTIISGIVGDNLEATQGMVGWTMDTIGTVVGNASQAIGDVLIALGGTIQKFEYSIEAKPYIKSKIPEKLFEVDEDGGLKFNGFPSFGVDFTGKAKGNSADLGTALTKAGNYFRDSGNKELYNKLNNIDTYDNRGRNTNSDSPYTAPNSPTDKDSGGGSGSSKDPHVAEIDKYKELTDAVENYERELDNLANVQDHTDDIDERIGLKQVEIKLYQRQKDALDALNKARDKEIAQNVELLRKQGFNVDYDPTSDNLLIHNREHINDLNQDIIETYEDLIEQTDDLNDANKDAQDQWNELTYAIIDAGRELKDLHFEKYEQYITEQEHLIKLMSNRDDALKSDLPIYDSMMNATLKMWQDLVDDGYEKNKDKIQELEEAWMDYYDSRIEREKELLEQELDDNDDALDAIIKVIDDEIEAIDDKIDALKKVNEEHKTALELQKAQAELDKARNQKTRHVLRKGKGWVWEADEDAIKEAEENLSDLEYDSKVQDLEDEKERLEDLKELWEEIPDIKQNEWNEQLMIDKLGADAESDILAGREETLEDFKDAYIDIQEQIKDKTDELEEHTSKAYLNVVKEFERLAKLAGIDFNLDDGKSESKTQSSWYVNKDGKAPSQAQVGDIVYTKGGTYQITNKDENGKFTSKKIDDVSTPIAGNQWGKKIGERVIESGEDVVDSVNNIIRTNEELAETERKQILINENLAKYISDGNAITDDNTTIVDDNTDEVENLSDDTEDNTDATDENTREIRGLSYNLQNLKFEVPFEELPEDPFAELDWGSMTTDEKNWINQMRDAYMTALEQGNEVFANNILGMLSDFQAGLGDEYIQIGKDALASANSNFEYGGKTSTGGGGGDGTKDRVADLEWMQSKVDEDPSKWSDDFKERLARAIAIEQYGSGTDSYKYDNGYMTTTIISATNEAENYMTADEIKQKYDYEHGDTDNGYDPEKMAETVADRIAEAIKDGADSVWGGFLPKDFDYATEVIKDNEESLKGYDVPTSNKGSSGGKTSGQKAMDDNNVSQSDRDKIAQAQKDYNDAKAKGDTQGMKDAHDRAEAIRNQNGYSGGVDGSQNIKTTSANTRSVSENTKATTYNADSTNDNTDSTDANTDSLDKNTEEHAKGYKVDVNVNVSGGSTSGGSGKGKGNGGNPNGGGDDGGYKMDNDPKSPTFGVKVKKAKGGSNLLGGIYNVNEKGDEIVLDKPKEGNWIRINTGGTVIPHEAAENMWNFGANPKMFLSDLLGYDAMKMNQQMVYMAGTGESKTIIENHYHDMHFHDVKDADGVKQMLANLPAYAEQHCTSRTRSVRTM